MYNKLFKDERVSLEMIDYQKDDKVIKELNSLFTELVRLGKDNMSRLVMGISYYRDKRTLTVIREIDKVVKDRFGFTIKHVNSEHIPYGTMPLVPSNDNILNDTAASLNGELKSYVVKTGTNEQNVKDLKRIKDIAKDERSIVYTMYKSLHELNKTLDTDKVKIDLKRATIKNLPKEYIIFVTSNFNTMIRTYDLTGEELTGVLLHEIGHMFTHLENSYRTVKTTTTLVDALLLDASKGKDIKKTISLSYKKVLGGGKEIDSKNEKVAAIMMLDRFMLQTGKLNSQDNHSATDSEALADQFATNFGVGLPLSTALHKMLTGGFKIRAIKKIDSVLLKVVTLFIVILLMIVLLPLVIYIMLVKVILNILLGSTDSNAITYDENKRRLERVKNDMVRILRTSDLSKQERRSFIKEIDSVVNLISNFKENDSIKLGGNVLPWNKASSMFKELEERLEDLTDNSLHLASNRLKVI